MAKRKKCKRCKRFVAISGTCLGCAVPPDERTASGSRAVPPDERTASSRNNNPGRNNISPDERPADHQEDDRQEGSRPDERTASGRNDIPPDERPAHHQEDDGQERSRVVPPDEVGSRPDERTTSGRNNIPLDERPTDHQEDGRQEETRAVPPNERTTSGRNNIPGGSNIPPHERTADHQEEDTQGGPRTVRDQICSRCNLTGHDRRTCRRKVHVFQAEHAAVLEELPNADQVDIDQEVGEADEDHCKHCHRTSTAYYILQFKTLDFSPVRRKYGDSNVQENDIVCSLCYTYLDRNNKQPGWCEGWPSMLWTLLATTTFEEQLRQLIRTLPRQIREMYSTYFTESGCASVIRNLHITPDFVDMTNKISDFSNDIEEASFGAYRNSMNDTSYPIIRCPMGCYTYVEQLQENQYDYIPLQHYIKKFYPAITSFNANLNKTKGFYPEFPNSILELDKFLVCPSMIIHEKKGLVILTCSTDVHENSVDYLHVPSNPLLGSNCPDYPDILSPVTLNPDVVREGKTAKSNTSYDVYRLKANQSGTSTCQLSLQRSTEVCPSPAEKMAMGLCLKERPDIYGSIINRDFLPQNYAQSALEWYSDITPDILEKIENAKKSGTYITLHDNLLLCKNMQLKHSSETGNGSSVNVSPLALVHGCDNAGHEPLLYPRHKTGDESVSAVVSTFLALLANCRPVYSAFLDHIRRQYNQIHADINDIILGLAKNLTTWNCTKKTTQKLWNNIKSSLPNELDMTEEHPFHYKVKCLLETLTSVSVLELEEGFHVGELLNAVDKVLVIHCTNDVEPDVPLSSDDKSCHHLFSLSYHPEGHEVSFSFRWSPDFSKWWHVASDGSVHVRDNPIRHPTFVVYASKNYTKCLNEQEYLNFYGCETKLRCSLHPEYYLVREFKGTGEKCSMCPLKKAYKCSYDLFPEKSCQTGLCNKHCKELQAADHPPPVQPRPDDERNPTQCVQNQDIYDLEDQPLAEIHFDQQLPSVDERNNNLMIDVNVPIPLMTERNPLHRVEASSTVTSGVYLLNSHLRCFSRSHLNKKPPIKWAQTLEMINSLTPAESFPLLQPEALLFPTIFWLSQDGSTVGALPNSMYGEHATKKTFGSMASLNDHLAVRLRDGSLLTSRSAPYRNFAFDVILNHSLYHNSMEVCFSKGLEHIVRHSSLLGRTERKLQFDEMESNYMAKNLAALHREYPWTFFVTLTCNDEETPGVSPIRRAIDALYVKGTRSWRRALQNNLSIMMRSWHRTIRYFFRIIPRNPTMFGPVATFFVRFEFQSHGAAGNKPHVHCGISLIPGSTTDLEDMDLIINKINGCFSRCRYTNEHDLIKDGLLDDMRDYHKLAALFQVHQQHNCVQRCKKRMADGSMKCRNRVHPETYKSFYDPFPNALEPSMDILRKLNLTEFDKKGHEVPNSLLRAGIWHPETEQYSNRVPTIALLYVLFRSQTNVQKCDPRSTASYSVKYACKKEEHRQVIVSNAGEGAVKMTPLDLYNQGITSARVAEENLRKAQGKHEPLLREIAGTEVTQFVHNLPYVMTNVEFISIQTQSLQRRAAIIKNVRSAGNKKILDEANKLIPVQSRQDFPQERKFTRNQEMMIRDSVDSPYLVDKTTSFSLRPPELMFVKKLQEYLVWFTRKSTKKYVCSLNVEEAPWVDGSCSIVKVRMSHLDIFREHCHKCFRDDGHSLLVHDMLQLLTALCNEKANAPQEFSDKFLRFVDIECTGVVVPVFSSVSPYNMGSFLYHLVLSMGSFETELDFFGKSMLECFEISNIIQSARDAGPPDANRITKNYIMDQLRCLPVSSHKANQLIPIVYHGLLKLVTNNEVVAGYVPLLTQRSIAQSATDDLLRKEDQILATMVKALEFDNPEVVQMSESLLSRAGCDFNIFVTGLHNQSRESVEQQNTALQIAKNAIDAYMDVATIFQRSILFCGAPGTGKSHLMQRVLLYCLSKNLRCIPTAITSERARKLGGEHLHYLIPIPIEKSSVDTCSTIAMKTINALGFSRLKHAFLKRLDILFFDEIGLLSSQMVSVLDIVLRSVRDIDQPYGGLLLVSTGDSEQLKPVDGPPAFRTTHFVTDFTVMMLTHPVRSREDSDLKELIGMLRRHDLTPEEKRRFISIFKRRCSRNFLPSFSDVPQDVLTIVSTKEAEKKANDTAISLKLAELADPSHHVAVDCEDTVEKGSKWLTADEATRRKLDRSCLEPRKLHLFLGAVMRLTFNNSHATARMPRFSQGQLAIITRLPSQDENWVTVKLVPPGERTVNPQSIPDSWEQACLTMRATVPISVASNMQRARRLQFPLCYNVASTIHKALGQSLPFIATCISKDKAMYRLWSRDLLLVIMSRVSNLGHIYFVGTLRDTIAAISDLLNLEDQMTKLQSETMENLDVLTDHTRVVAPTRPLPLRLEDCDVPSVDIGFVYLAVSSKDTSLARAGKCLNIRKELNCLNRELAGSFDPSAPYFLMSFITGFFSPVGSEDHALQMELTRRHMDYRMDVSMALHQRMAMWRELFARLKATPGYYQRSKLLILKECYSLPDTQ